MSAMVRCGTWVTTGTTGRVRPPRLPLVATYGLILRMSIRRIATTVGTVSPSAGVVRCGADLMNLYMEQGLGLNLYAGT